jgi:hypothetical protein
VFLSRHVLVKAALGAKTESSGIVSLTKPALSQGAAVEEVTAVALTLGVGMRVGLAVAEAAGVTVGPTWVRPAATVCAAEVWAIWTTSRVGVARAHRLQPESVSVPIKVAARSNFLVLTRFSFWRILYLRTEKQNKTGAVHAPVFSFDCCTVMKPHFACNCP